MNTEYITNALLSGFNIFQTRKRGHGQTTTRMCAQLQKLSFPWDLQGKSELKDHQKQKCPRQIKKLES